MRVNSRRKPPFSATFDDSKRGAKVGSPPEKEPEKVVEKAGLDPVLDQKGLRIPSFSVDLGGRIDPSQLRNSTREKLRVVFSDPDLAQKLGIERPSAPASDADAALYATHVAPALYHAVNALLVTIPRRWGYTAEQAQVMALTDPEIAGFCPLTGTIIAKHVSPSSKYAEEYMLAAMVLATISGKLALLEKSATVLRLQRQEPPTMGGEGA